MMDNPFEQYKKNTVNTMTKGELLILLFDEAVKKLNQSKILMKCNDYDGADKALEKCRKIFNNLIVSLDSNFNLSRELKEMYSFFNKEIIMASSMKNPEYIDGILPIVKDMRNTWAEADRLARKSKV